MKTIKAYFSRNYFSKEFPLEYRVYMIFFFEALLISILSATTNTLLGKGILGVTLQWAVIALCVMILVIPLDKRMAILKPLLVFITYVYIPFLFFQTAGYNGTALLFSLLGIFLLAIIFKGRARIVALALNILILVGCCLAQYFMPDLIVPHATAADKLVDLVVALVLATSGLAIMTVYISNAYEIERERIKTLMNSDTLTGAFARRYLYEQLPRELSISERTNRPLSLLILDVDLFKLINDTHGHVFGDEVLKAVSHAMKKELRPYDILARFGGEEFVVVLPNTSFEEGRAVADRLRTAVEKLSFENNTRVTISAGVTTYHHGEPLDEIINRADGYLYEAKHSGRNCVFGER